MRIAFFEDSAAADFSPLALLRPVFELTCGRYSLRERIVRFLPIREWGALVRTPLAETYAESHPEAFVNDYSWLAQSPTLLINGRWLPDVAAIDQLAQPKPDSAGIVDGTVVWFHVDPLEASLLSTDEIAGGVAGLAQTRRHVESSGRVMRRPWDPVNRNADQLLVDFELSRRNPVGRPPIFREISGPQTAILGPPHQVQIDPSAEIDPFVVIDARHGPVTIDARVHIQAFTRLEGPCHVGHGTRLFRANLRAGSTVGPVCRVGGEIEESILHGYVNKYHDGFLGHSYVCPWVNLGALTTNSDLKNDYSTVRVPIGGESIDSGLPKVGCFLGDHTKTALASLFNTGSSIGVGCMVLPAGELLPKHIPSFSRIWHGVLDDGIDVDQALATARTAMERRNHEFTPAQERLLRWVFHETEAERDAAKERAQAKRRQPAYANA